MGHEEALDNIISTFESSDESGARRFGPCRHPPDVALWMQRAPTLVSIGTRPGRGPPGWVCGSLDVGVSAAGRRRLRRLSHRCRLPDL